MKGDSEGRTIDLKEAVSFLQKILPEAGRILKRHFKDREFSIKQKEGVDFTTQTDTEVDQFLREKISQKYPDHQFLTEETAPDDYSRSKNEENLWVIDPLDGTINFSRGKTNFAISVAFMRKEKVLLGAVYLPMSDRYYSASDGIAGAFLNGEKIHVSKTENLREVVLGTDWGWDLEKRQNIVNWLNQIKDKVRQVQSLGSAASDLAALACGESDAYFHSGIKPWDVAASGFIIQKAGGKVTDIDGSKWSPFKSEILASNGKLHARILSLLGPNLKVFRFQPAGSMSR